MPTQWEPTADEQRMIDAATAASNARMRAARLREHGPALADLLRRIVAAQEQFFAANETGPQEVFQRAADEFHDAVDAAADHLRSLREIE